MKPETRTVPQLFGLGVRYVVPLYQSPKREVDFAGSRP